jgi:hypothetical protein
LILSAYPELQILFDGDGHGRGRELHVCDGRGTQCLIRHQADLVRWFGDRPAPVPAAKLPQALRQRSLF